MRKHETMLALATETATNSPFRMAHGAVLVRSGVVLAKACNHLGGNRLSPSCPSTHAEIATLARFFGGNVKQCFEKPSEEFYSSKQRQSNFDPFESERRASRSSEQHKQQQPDARQCGGLPVCSTLQAESGVRCSKRKDTSDQEDHWSLVLWNEEDKGHTQSKEALCGRLRYVYC
jgi:hypothetical protein